MARKKDQKTTLFLSAGLIAVLALLAGIRAASIAIVNAPGLRVSEIEVQWPEQDTKFPARFKLGQEQSIFKVNLAAIHQDFQARYPAAKIMAVRRVLPNRVVVDITSRSVIGELRAGERYYAISDEGVIVSKGHRSPEDDMPRIFMRGVPSNLKIGQQIQTLSFKRIAQLLQTISAQQGLAGRNAAQIKTNGRDIILNIDSGLEIRFSEKQLWSEWQKLALVLQQRPELLDQKKYIDLRFADPVIGNRK